MNSLASSASSTSRWTIDGAIVPNSFSARAHRALGARRDDLRQRRAALRSPCPRRCAPGRTTRRSCASRAVEQPLDHRGDAGVHGAAQHEVLAVAELVEQALDREQHELRIGVEVLVDRRADDDARRARPRRRRRDRSSPSSRSVAIRRSSSSSAPSSQNGIFAAADAVDRVGVAVVERDRQARRRPAPDRAGARRDRTHRRSPRPVKTTSFSPVADVRNSPLRPAHATSELGESTDRDWPGPDPRGILARLPRRRTQGSAVLTRLLRSLRGRPLVSPPDHDRDRRRGLSGGRLPRRLALPVGLNGVVDTPPRLADSGGLPERARPGGVSATSAPTRGSWSRRRSSCTGRSREHDSFWWNPYSASGSLGPETLADMKLSPSCSPSRCSALPPPRSRSSCSRSSSIALWCLQQLFVRTLGLGRLAAVAACFVFLFAGFASSDFSSAVGAPYVWFPIVVYTLAEYRRVGGVARFGAAVLAYAGFILTTFVPIQLLMLVFVQTVAIVIDGTRTTHGRGRDETALRAAPRRPQPRRTGRRSRRHRVRVAAPARCVAAHGRRHRVVRRAGAPELGEAPDAEDPLAVGHEHALSGWASSGIATVVTIAAAWSHAAHAERLLLATTVAIGATALALHRGSRACVWPPTCP